VQLLKDLRHLASSRTDTAIILVLRGTTPAESNWYFGDMYDWLAVPHKAATGSVGSALADRFQVRTILALVLLDPAGKVICTNGRGRLTADRLGRDFPWRDPACIQKPTVNFDLPGRARPLDLPPLQLRPQLAPQGGPPPAFTCCLSDLARPPASKATSVTPSANINLTADVHQRAQRRGDVARNPSETTQRLPQLAVSTPVSVPEARPLPKPNRGTTLGLGVKTYSPATDSARGDGRQKLEDIPQGKHTSLMQSQPLAGIHPFTPTLRKWEHGIPVDCGLDWDWNVIKAAVARGPHPTAKTPDSIALFQDDIEYQIKAGFCRVFLWEDIVKLRPTNLKISPVAVVPQVNQWGRIILDLSFPVYQELNGVITITQKSVNESTAYFERIVPPSPLPTPKMEPKGHSSIIMQLVGQSAQWQPWPNE
jgi:hypothetical protein